MTTVQSVTPDVPFALSYRLEAPRLYRPAHDALRPALVEDGLHADLMGLGQ